MTETIPKDAASTSSGGTVLQTRSEGIATLWLDNPAHKNAMTPAMCRDLIETLERINRDPSVRVLMLRGASGNFSAGAAIDEVENVLYDDFKSPQDVGMDWLTAADEAISAMRCPIISVVEGICMGGAWQIAAAADIVLASTTARLAITPAKLGIVYPRRGLERLVRHAGPDRAKYILFLAEEINIQDALEWNLVTKVVAAGDLEVELARIAEVVQKRSNFSTFHHKELINAYCTTGPGDPLYEDQWITAWAGVLTSGDLEEGRQAFLGKQNPRFKWSPTSAY
ncbi:enoyl-CoA hydratase/isomerase family protein [Kocuria rhizophila]|uniref:enoyl-CoA hydratase/isomerase family protein n=1 Tax=Kocuria rhizophila TaxID=72000 RepID=UPI0022F132C6|nr:enoyl-CoA hydratase/isomerase family protein [Kocuria rhizophila]MDA4827671.1 enoyl-CoA hydratase/isomerase family protein [Kocuria rhizophila]WSQ04041.1 enoyl-CoA hydratase/isomerase family protein [Kocuria rhizophila]